MSSFQFVPGSSVRHGRAAALPTIPLTLAALLTCTDSRAPTAAREADRPPPGFAVVSGEGNGATVQGTIPLPVNQTFSGTSVAFGITQTGSGPSGAFKIN